MSDKLGCFGSVLFHSADARRCQVCPQREACAAQVQTNDAKLKQWYQDLVTADPKARKTKTRAMLGIEASASSKSDPATTASVARATTTSCTSASGRVLTAVKPREFVQRWQSKGIDFLAYKNGVNPFTTSGNKFAQVAMQLFMDKRSVTRTELIDELVAKAGANGPWGLTTAMSHAGIVLQAFEFLEIINITGGTAHLR